VNRSIVTDGSGLASETFVAILLMLNNCVRDACFVLVDGSLTFDSRIVMTFHSSHILVLQPYILKLIYEIGCVRRLWS
jgi:hypothetical protein